MTGLGHRRGGLRTATSLMPFIFLVKIVTGFGSKKDLMVVEDFPATVTTNRCSDLNLAGFETAMNCGPPLSAPCFDFDRCRDDPKVYVYDSECSLEDSKKIESRTTRRKLHTVFRASARRAGVLADTYESACFFIHAESHLRSEPPCATTAPLWNDGQNHVMVDVSDPARDRRASYSGSYAMEAATSQHTCYYRTGYDISIGHYPKVVFHELQSTAPLNRRYFLTFRGALYLESMRGSEERASIMKLHDYASGVIVVEKCAEYLVSHWPEYTERCAQLLPNYSAYDFELLMNTTFALLPGGGSPGTHRLAEVMSAGSIPVFVTRDYVKPFPEKVDWSEFSFTFSPDEVPDMLRTLRSVPPEELQEMQRKTLEAYWKIYGGYTNYLRTARLVVDIIFKRIGHRYT